MHTSNNIRGSSALIAGARDIPAVKSNGDSSNDSAGAASGTESSPTSRLMVQVIDIQQSVLYVQDQINKVHGLLGGALPEKKQSGDIASPPCGGALGVLIEATDRIRNTLEESKDTLGYLRALIA